MLLWKMLQQFSTKQKRTTRDTSRRGKKKNKSKTRLFFSCLVFLYNLGKFIYNSKNWERNSKSSKSKKQDTQTQVYIKNNKQD